MKQWKQYRLRESRKGNAPFEEQKDAFSRAENEEVKHA
jgi:hypothetical protein